MNCIKCGSKCKSKHIFCDECHDGMKEYPVKPGTPIYLPSRGAPAQERKKPAKKKRNLKPDELIARLRTTNRWLLSALIISLFALLMACAALIFLLEGWEMPNF